MKTRKLSLELELKLESPEAEAYFFAQPTGNEPEGADAIPTLRLAFLADLFDLLNFEGSLGVQSINGWTHDKIKKALAL